MVSAYVQDCWLRADGPIYYTTREIGRLYETGDHIHNFALTYALGFATAPYHINEQRPTYQADLAIVTAQNIYITPATPRRVTHTISSLKFGGEHWQEKERKKSETGNVPNYGRIKEIAPGSEFSFWVISSEPVHVVRWIRLGLWMTKCEVQVLAAGTVPEKQGTYQYGDALNPLDLDATLLAFDIVPMPPNSLIRNATVTGQWLIGRLSGQPSDVHLPARMSYLRQTL